MEILLQLLGTSIRAIADYRAKRAQWQIDHPTDVLPDETELFALVNATGADIIAHAERLKDKYKPAILSLIHI